MGLNKFEELSTEAIKEKITTVRTIYIGIYFLALALFIKSDIHSISNIGLVIAFGLGFIAVLLAFITNDLIDIMDENIKKDKNQ
jgi:hypothetical protein